MQNGTNEMPSEEQVNKLLQQIDAVKGGIERFILSLNVETKTSPKWRRGYQTISEQCVNLANQHKLEIPGVSTAEITAQRTRAARLRPLQQSVEELAGKLGTAVFAAQSQSWAATTDLYTALKWMSRRNANLRRELAPVTAFFANGKRKPKPTPPATPPAK